MADQIVIAGICGTREMAYQSTAGLDKAGPGNWQTDTLYNAIRWLCVIYV